LKERGINWVPRSLNEAIDCLAEDSVLAQTIGRSIWEEFIKIKRTEWDKYSRYVSDWELNTFASRF
jgi:glutamine synthetase